MPICLCESRPTFERALAAADAAEARRKVALVDVEQVLRQAEEPGGDIDRAERARIAQLLAPLLVQVPDAGVEDEIGRGITLGFGISDNATLRRRFELLWQVLLLLFLQGFGNLFSLTMVLLARSPCEFDCSVRDVNPMHVLATNVTIYCADITAAAFVLGALRFRRARRGPGARAPSIMAP